MSKIGTKVRSLRLLRHRIHFGVQNVASRVRGSIYGNAIHAYWYRRRPNFGDFLTPLILERFGFTPVYSAPQKAQIVSTGSILHLMPPNFSGVILGSGLIQEQRMLFPAATVLAVRGALTRRLLELSSDTPLGDPGLLANLILAPVDEKKHVMGIVPHLVDKSDPRLSDIERRYTSEVKIIDVQRHPIKVLSEIASCQHILSSSLHGLIVADAYGIPNRWLTLSDHVLGGGFKFHDYYSAVGQSSHPATISGVEKLAELVNWTLSPPAGVSEAQAMLKSVFGVLHQYLKP